jgi:hypothetical protein
MALKLPKRESSVKLVHCCLIDLAFEPDCYGCLRGLRAGVGAVIVRAFMIAVRRYFVGASMSPASFDALQYKRGRPVWCPVSLAGG